MICHQTPRPQPNLSFELQLRQDSPEEDASRYGDLRRRKRSPPIHSALNSHDREFPVAHNALVLASPRILHERKKIGQIRLSPFSVLARRRSTASSPARRLPTRIPTMLPPTA